MKNQKPAEEKKEKKDFQYVYFIENHIESEASDISLSENYNEVGELEVADQNIYEPDKNYKYTIYRFKIYNSKLDAKNTKNWKLKLNLKLMLVKNLKIQ